MAGLSQGYLLNGLYFFFLAMVILAGKLPAQIPEDARDYILSYKGDTTWGYIFPGNYFRDQRRIQFLDQYGVKTTYQSDRIAGFGYGDKHYVTKITPYYFSGVFSDSTIFLWRRIHGPTSLYRFYKQRSILTFAKGPSYFELIEKPDGRLYEVSFTFKWKRVAAAFSDYPELMREIENGLYKPDEMDRIVEVYNAWYREK
ncbi:MAG: hypothetical protein SF052_04820 [Bacteroidia bacterium]|nr:hypothetical protein [Bacteroidia bacterium]